MKPPSKSLFARPFPLIAPLFLLVLGIGLPSIAAAQDEISIANPSFEQVDEKTGVPTHWTPWSATNQAVYTLATAHSGVASAMITDSDAKMSQGLRCEAVPVTPGRTYEASCWVKIAELEAGGFALYLEYWNGTQRVKDVASSCMKAGDWQLLKVSAPAPDNAEQATVLIYGASATVGVAYFDDVALRAVP
jgi:hypothetical protein